MAVFKLNENRLIDIDEVVVIHYTPADSMTVANPKPSQRTPSYLNIKLKSRSEEIRLEGEAADAAWADYQKASKSKKPKG